MYMNDELNVTAVLVKYCVYWYIYTVPTQVTAVTQSRVSTALQPKIQEPGTSTQQKPGYVNMIVGIPR